MNYLFDGPNKIITPTDAPILGAINVDVQDMYSRWVDWLITGDNSKYLQAMRVVGGDPLPGSKKLGITYFLLNGWKIRPYEANHVFSLNGNIYSEDGSSPFTGTVGAYNVTIINSVSNLVDSTVQQLPEIEHASFNGKVTIDVDNGVAGTGYPIGTPTNPVNNLSDAKTIAGIRGFTHIDLLSDLTISTGENVDELHFTSDDWKVITIQSGVSMTNTNFERVSMYGVMGGIWNILIDCWVYDISNFIGWMRNGSFENISLAEGIPGAEFGSQSFFDDIVPLYPGVVSTITCNTNTEVAISNYTGLLLIKSVTTNGKASIGFNTGKITLDNTNTGGIIKILGVCELVDNSNGSVVDDDTLNKENITDTVWDEQTSLHTQSGSTGEAIASGGGSGGLTIQQHNKLMATVDFTDLIIAKEV